VTLGSVDLTRINGIAWRRLIWLFIGVRRRS
ncbi:MAG: hypothetical protein ACI814_003989, partial [Mariniblastus sp.]